MLCEKLEAQNCRLENEVVELKAALEKQTNDHCEVLSESEGELKK